MLKLLEREYGSDLDVWVRVGDKDDKEDFETLDDLLKEEFK